MATNVATPFGPGLFLAARLALLALLAVLAAANSPHASGAQWADQGFQNPNTSPKDFVTNRPVLQLVAPLPMASHMPLAFFITGVPATSM